MSDNVQPIRILIADDHPVFRHGLRTLLEAKPDLQTVGEAAHGRDAVELAHKLKPDVLMLDLAMPQLSGLDVLRALANSRCNVRTIMLTVAIEKPQIIEALQLGARGLVLKEAATQLVIKSIRSVMGGQYWIGREAVSDLVQCVRHIQAASRPETRAAGFGLTPRELEIVSAIVAGDTNKEIAQKLSLSEDTVKHHLTSIFDKVGASHRLELAVFAIHHRLVP